MDQTTNKEIKNNNQVKYGNSLVRPSSICVFCGSGQGLNPNFKIAARQLGQLLAENNIQLIYGGGDMGLMGTLAKSTLTHGGKVTGIIPEFLLKYQKGGLKLSNQIVTKDMHTRKATMYDLADAFVALPGGIGTLEELVETMTWSQLGTHQKPIALLNIDEFWQPFLALIEHMKSENFIRKGLEVNFHICENLETLLDQLSSNEDNQS